MNFPLCNPVIVNSGENPVKILKPVGLQLMQFILVTTLAVSGCSPAVVDQDPDGSESAPPEGAELAEEVEMPPVAE